MDILTPAFAQLLVNFLGGVLGTNYEIIYYTVEGDSAVVAAVSHGHISGQYIGMPATEPIATFVTSKVWQLGNTKHDYRVVTETNQILSSSCLFLKDSAEQLCGILAINMNVKKYQKLCEDILSLANITCLSTQLNLNTPTPMVTESAAPIPNSVEHIIKSEVDRYTSGKKAEKLSASTRLAIVENLCQKDVFNVKGAVSTVANHLKCSEASVYRYLSHVKNHERGQEPPPPSNLPLF